ncbi:MAG: NAD(P)H:quinone oxidoreductase [Planctomycetota bacterium]
MKVNIVFHSLYGHIYKLAEAVAEGAGEVDGVEVNLHQVQETLPQEVLAEMGAVESKKAFAHLPVATPDVLAESDGIVFGTPTRFGMMSAQMRALLDATGGLWVKGSLVGKPGSVFTSSNTQHGGQESTILSFHATLLHHGMVIVGPGYAHPGVSESKEISGGSPYGASTIAGSDGSRVPTENELAVARFQGKIVAEIAKKLAA